MLPPGGVAVTTTLSGLAEHTVPDVMNLCPTLGNSSTGGVPNYMTAFRMYSAASRGPPMVYDRISLAAFCVCLTTSLEEQGGLAEDLPKSDSGKLSFRDCDWLDTKVS